MEQKAAVGGVMGDDGQMKGDLTRSQLNKAAGLN
jgi:hypothetical protein